MTASVVLWRMHLEGVETCMPSSALVALTSTPTATETSSVHNDASSLSPATVTLGGL